VTTRAVDAIIIGGGITGVSTAFQLAGMGLRRVLVLEKAFIGAGGTGRSVGIIRQLYPTRETSEMVLRSLAVFERFGEAVGGSSGFVGAIGPSFCASASAISAAYFGTTTALAFRQLRPPFAEMDSTIRSRCPRQFSISSSPIRILL
jgi:sarcosine oxidase subunit beta